MFMGERLNVDSMLIFPTLLNRINGILIKITIGFSTKVEKLIVKFIWKCKAPELAKNT